MKKMPCLFRRSFYDDRKFVITEEVTPGCEWVLAGEGVATRKWDGTACAVIDGLFYKRYDAKKDRKTGEYRLPPEGAIPCDVPDPTTGHWPHWVRVGTGPEDKHHREALDLVLREAPGRPFRFRDGTYELCGPPINGNHEKLGELRLFRHGAVVCNLPDRSLAGLREYLAGAAIEGFVFHHPDGRMCKIRRHDFGFDWPAAEKP